MRPAVIVSGPKGCGKTKFAHKIAEALGCVRFRDNWRPGLPQPDGWLLLTHHEVEGAIDFKNAMNLVKAGPALSAAEIAAREASA